MGCMRRTDMGIQALGHRHTITAPPLDCKVHACPMNLQVHIAVKMHSVWPRVSCCIRHCSHLLAPAPAPLLPVPFSNDSSAAAAPPAFTCYLPSPCIKHPPTMPRRQPQALSLTQNNFAGSIPAALTHLTNLASLQLDANALTSSLPPEFSSMTQLMQLSVSRNKLSGPLPPSYKYLSKLIVFDASFNNFTVCTAACVPAHACMPHVCAHEHAIGCMRRRVSAYADACMQHAAFFVPACARGLQDKQSAKLRAGSPAHLLTVPSPVPWRRQTTPAGLLSGHMLPAPAPCMPMHATTLHSRSPACACARGPVHTHTHACTCARTHIHTQAHTDTHNAAGRAKCARTLFRLQGGIPNDWCYLDAANAMRSLSQLSCNGCGLSGPLLQAMYCTSLTELSLAGGECGAVCN